MTLRKVLLLTYHFPPSGAVAVYRMLGLVRYLPRYGWQPIVVAPPHVPWEPYDSSLLELVPSETPIERVPFATGIVGRLVQHLAPEAHWLYKAWPACRHLIHEHSPEAVVTSSPPGCVHRLGLWVKAKYKLPWLADFRDPWVTNAQSNEFPIHRVYERGVERKVMSNATKLIANTPLNQQGWAKEFPEQAHKIEIITNGFDPERFTHPTPRNQSAGVNVVHTGELYVGRDPRPFLDALQQLDVSDRPASVDFIGRSTEGEFSLPAEIERRGLSDHVKVVGQIRYGDALARMMNADILLLVHTPGQSLGVPAKLYEYLGAGRPILALAEPESDVGWVLRESKVLHRIVPVTDVAAIRLAITELSRAARANEPVAVDPQALQKFTREHMARRFAECLDSVCGPRDARTS